jgi:hypothetical protein
MSSERRASGRRLATGLGPSCRGAMGGIPEGPQGYVARATGSAGCVDRYPPGSRPGLAICRPPCGGLEDQRSVVPTGLLRKGGARFAVLKHWATFSRPPDGGLEGQRAGALNQQSPVSNKQWNGPAHGQRGLCAIAVHPRSCTVLCAFASPRLCVKAFPCRSGARKALAAHSKLQTAAATAEKEKEKEKEKGAGEGAVFSADWCLSTDPESAVRRIEGLPTASRPRARATLVMAAPRWEHGASFG